MSSWSRLGLVGALLLACDGRSEPRAVASALPAGVAARVGADLISSDSVARIAASQGLAPKAALAAAVSDAVWAGEARLAVAPGTTSTIERAAAARSLLEQLARDAERRGPPSATELSELKAERWLDLDRPEAVRATHAVVMNDKPDKAAAARLVAERVAAAVKPATTSEEFMTLAKAVPTDGFELRAEVLPLVTADGRTFERRRDAFVAGGPFDATFARAAHQLEAPGSLSPLIETRFGFHVIRLEERVPGVSVPAAELPSLLASETRTRRASLARAELLKSLKQSTKVDVDRAYDELTAKPKFAP